MREVAPAFVQEFGDDRCGVALLDADAGFRIDIPAWQLHADEGPNPRASSSAAGRVFTDLNSWALKLLVLERAPERYGLDVWRSAVLTQVDLARVAGVSTCTVHKLILLLVERGHLASPRTLRLREVDRLLHDGLADTAARMPERQPAKSIFGEGGPWDASFKGALPGRAALGGFHAAHRLDLSIRPAAGVSEVHVEGDVHNWMSALDLEPCPESDAQLVLRSSATPERVFRGAHRAASVGGLPVVDVLQVALDVVDRPARGREQADHVVQRVAQWWAP